jgi:membrane protein implicated in regulation of membrane protease activity
MQKPRLPAGLRVSTTLRSAFLLLAALLLIALLAFLPGLLLLLLLPALLLATLLLAALLLLFLVLILILILAHGVLSHRRVRDGRSSRKRHAGTVRSSGREVGTSSYPQELMRHIIIQGARNGTLSSAMADRCAAAGPPSDLAPGRTALASPVEAGRVSPRGTDSATSPIDLTIP